MGELNKIVNIDWISDSWQDTTVVSYYSNAEGLLIEREERQLFKYTLLPPLPGSNEQRIVRRPIEFVLSHELYEYDENGNVTLISFPDTPWFRVRAIFKITTIERIGLPDLIRIDPYLLTSQIQRISYTYNSSGFLDRINYVSFADVIQDSIFFATN